MGSKKKSFSVLVKVLLICLIVACVPLCFVGCGDKSKQFVGSYKSVYSDVDQHRLDGKVCELTFDLTINKDKTFSLKKVSSNLGLEESILTVSGTYTTITENGKTTMICFMEESLMFNSEALKPYFSLTFDDNGKLLATPSYSANYASAFGYDITLVVFEKV